MLATCHKSQLLRMSHMSPKTTWNQPTNSTSFVPKSTQKKTLVLSYYKWLLRPTKTSMHPPLALSSQLWELVPVPDVYGDHHSHSFSMFSNNRTRSWSHITLLETNISHPKDIFEDYFPFLAWWDMLVPWQIGQLCERFVAGNWSTSALTASRMAGQPSPLTASTRLC